MLGSWVITVASDDSILLAGLTETEGTAVLSDVMLMRIAQRVRKDTCIR